MTHRDQTNQSNEMNLWKEMTELECVHCHIEARKPVNKTGARKVLQCVGQRNRNGHLK